ncbi:MAG: hypothetical protein ACOZBZ_03125 [Patescibacteria group bacterium]
MRKEVLVAILVGFALGLVITFGIWSANKALTSKKAPIVPEEVTAPTVEVTPTPSFSLAISKPEDESIASTEKITISGTTEPGAFVVVIAEKGEEILETDEKGIFTGEVSLVSGTNEITVTAFSENGEEVSKTLNIVYSTAEI